MALTTFKNSNGEAKQRIYPRVLFKHPDINEGTIKVDFDIADARLLTDKDVPRSELKSEGICDVKASSKAGLYNDEVNGLKMVPITDITQNLYESPDKLAALRSKLNITKMKTIEELYDEGWYKDARAAKSEDDD